MRNFWIIAVHEYRKIAARKGFLIGVIGMPLLIIAVMGLSIFMSINDRDNRPIGYVDQAGMVSVTQDPDASISMTAYPDEAAARAALQGQEIQGYYVIGSDYLQSRQVDLYYLDKEPSNGAQDDFSGFLRRNLAAGMPEDVRTRLVDGPEVTVRSQDGRREIGDGNVLGFFLPFIASFLFIFSVMSSAGYMLQVVTDEKENRTVEILLTSLSPEALIGGKAVGLMAVAFTQLGIWLFTAVLGLMVAANFFDWIGALRVPWDFLGIIVLFFIPAYALVVGIQTAIGGSVTELRQGQQVAGLLNMLFMLPFFFLVIIMTNPSSPIVMFMSFFPTTSFLTMSLRWGLDVVPVWQLVLSWVILAVSAVISVWASARIFRAGMLRYGQRLSLTGMWAALRS